MLQICRHTIFLIYFSNLNRCTKCVGMMYIVCSVTACIACFALQNINYRLGYSLQPLLLGRRIHPSAMVLDQLDQGVSGTFHSNAALHNSLQKERCIVFSRMMGTAASGQGTADQKKHCSITGSQPHLRALGVLTGPGSSSQ